MPLGEKASLALYAVSFALIAIGGIPVVIFHYGGIAITGASAMPPEVGNWFLLSMATGMAMIFVAAFFAWIRELSRNRWALFLRKAIVVLASSLLVIASIILVLAATLWMMR